jgi:plasmid stabilization system protein ParE
MPRKVAVLATANFERNLSDIRDFLAADVGPAFEGLVDQLSQRIIPALESFPGMGADFTARAPLSAEGRALFEHAIRLASPGGRLRQLIDGDYVILYLVRDTSIYLLSIRHHRQLSFDFMGHWP